MQYMIVPRSAMERRTRTSEHFPTIVEAPEGSDAEYIMSQCFDEPFSPAHNKQYYIVPMTDAVLVTFKKRQDYDVVTTRVYP